MEETIKCIGMEVHMQSRSVAIAADGPRGKARFPGLVHNTAGRLNPARRANSATLRRSAARRMIRAARRASAGGSDSRQRLPGAVGGRQKDANSLGMRADSRGRRNL